MKSISPSKTARIIGLTATLIAVASTSIKQAAQAQTQPEFRSQLNSMYSIEPINPGQQAQFCKGDYSFLPERVRNEDGSDFFFAEFMGINLSPEQNVVYRQLIDGLQVTGESLLERAPSEQDLVNGDISFSAPTDVPPNAYEQINAKRAVLDADSTLTSQRKVVMLNEQFGQYGEFAVQETFNFTPEQLVESEESVRNYQAKMLSIFDPEQQQVYLENLFNGFLLTALVDNATGSCGQ